MRLNKRWLLLGLSIFLIIALAACGGGKDQADEQPAPAENEKPEESNGESESGGGEGTADLSGESILMATPSIGSTHHTMGTGAGEFLYRQLGLNVSVEPIGGGEAPIFQMGDGTVDSAWVNTGVVTNAYNGTGQFEGNPVDVRLFSLGETTFRPILVPKGSDITSLEDLRGKVFMGLRPGISEFEVMTNAILEYTGMSESDLNIVSNTTSGETVDALRTRSVDAAILPAAASNPNLTELYQDEAAEILALDDETMQGLHDLLKDNGFIIDTIKAGDYPNLDEDRQSLGLVSTWVVSADLDEEIVYNMAKAIWDNFEEFSKIHPGAAKYSVENNTESAPPIPFHPGVKKYFEEIGVWDDSLDVE